MKAPAVRLTTARDAMTESQKHNFRRVRHLLRPELFGRDERLEYYALVRSDPSLGVKWWGLRLSEPTNG
jgi:hypothetical protein